MTINATYNGGELVINNAVIKITRIWGSKSEGWNAWVSVFRPENLLECATVFSAVADYVEGENPFVALYNSIAALPFLSDIKHDDPQGKSLEIKVDAMPISNVSPTVNASVKPAKKKKSSE